ncbi:MAG: tandem-95 repeat protein [Gammaproteobacteria bacterium]|nr:tandem-95 repeat protein [Gammaproteobacteria bacterium]
MATNRLLKNFISLLLLFMTVFIISCAHVSAASAINNKDIKLSTLEDTSLEILPKDLLDDAESSITIDKLAVDKIFDVDKGDVSMSGNKIIFTPEANYNGDAHFKYSFVDNQGIRITGLVTIEIKGVNDPPVAHDDFLINLNLGDIKEDSSNVVIPTESLLINDIDENKSKLLVSAVSPNSTGGGTVFLVGSNIIYSPKENFNGEDSFTYTIKDENGATDQALVRLNVLPVNDAPIAQDDNLAISESSSLDIPIVSLLGNDTDPDGDPLTFSGFTSGINSEITYSESDNGLHYTAHENFNGTDIFTYTIRDSHQVTSTGRVTVNVVPKNGEVFMANNDNIAATEDMTKIINTKDLLINDIDLDHNGIVITSVTAPKYGTATLSDNKETITYVSPKNFHGEDSFTYNTSSGNSEETSAGMVKILVAAVDDIYAALPDKFVTNKNIPLVLKPSQLLSNDTNPDQGSIIITSVSQPVNGTIDMTEGKIIFTPTQNFSGTGSFKYKATNGKDSESESLVTVTVNP